MRLDQIGDVLMTTPAIRALRESAPGRHVTLLAAPSGAEVARLAPEIDDVVVYDAPWMKASPARGDRSRDRAIVDGLRERRFDAAVVFTVYSQSPLPAAYLCYLAGIPRVLAHVRENPYQLVTDWARETEPQREVRHEVRRQLDLVSTVGASTRDETLSLDVPQAARRRAAAAIAGIDEACPWAVVHPGASAPSRRYPAEHYVEVCERLVRDHGWQIVFSGAPDEVDLVESIRASMTSTSSSLAGTLDVATLAAVLELAPVLIAGNSGPVHIAAAVGTPVVDLYALTNPQHTPWGVEHEVLSHDVPCKYCYSSVCPMGHHDCLRLVRPSDVVDAAMRLGARTAARRAPM
ncbi:MAG TPA: glycosyltransferase family 9 protein [Actinomycetota bacterium]|nr:glycosyltransferase family 9 protein [Actinomycetota bacterium]